MCNLYNLTTNQQAIRDFVSITHDLAGNLETSVDIYLDRFAPSELPEQEEPTIAQDLCRASGCGIDDMPGALLMLIEAVSRERLSVH